MKLSREWATPLTIGVFVLMAATGLLMFFHFNTHTQETVHEWAGWLMVAAVLTHVTVNWLSFKRYLVARGKGLVIIVACVLGLAASFFIGAGGNAEPGAPAIAIGALSKAPIGRVAPLFGKTGAQARADLARAGITLADDDRSIASAIGGDRGRMGAALNALTKPSP